MRVALVSNLYEPYVVGGAERLVAHLAAQLEEAGHDVAILTTRLAPSLTRIEFGRRASGVWEFAPANVYPYAVAYESGTARARPPIAAMRPLHFLLDAFASRPERAIGRFVQIWKPDVFHTHNLRSFGLRALRAAAHYAPLVHTIHDGALVCLTGLLRHPDGVECYGDRWPCKSLAPSYKRLTKHTAAVLTAPSQFYLDLFGAHGLFDGSVPMLVRQHAVASGLPADRIAALRDEARCRRARDRRIRALFIGQIAEHKGIETLLRAARSSGCTDVRIIGMVSETKQREFSLLGATVVGPLSGESKWREIAKADVICLPSTWPENAPQVIEEAFSCGVPIIASRTGGVPERVRHGCNGLLVTPSSESELASALRLLTDSSRYAALESDAAKSAGHFDDTVKEFVRSYGLASHRRALTSHNHPARTFVSESS